MLRDLRECKIHGVTSYFLTGNRWRCSKCAAERVSIHRHKKKKWCVDYLGGSCIRCGYNKYIGALEFHHRNPSEKEFTFSENQKKSYVELQIELDKCDLLCSNCHKEVHAGLA